MTWRIVKQPNGKLARFSDTVNNFTHRDMTEDEALSLCRKYYGIKIAKEKVRAGVEDWKPGTKEVKGCGIERWLNCVSSMRDTIDGTNEVCRVAKEIFNIDDIPNMRPMDIIATDLRKIIIELNKRKKVS